MADFCFLGIEECYVVGLRVDLSTVTIVRGVGARRLGGLVGCCKARRRADGCLLVVAGHWVLPILGAVLGPFGTFGVAFGGFWRRRTCDCYDFYNFRRLSCYEFGRRWDRACVSASTPSKYG